MRKHTLALAAALVLTTAAAAATAQTPAPGANEPVTISPEELHRQIDGRSLPLTFIEEPY
jgi:Spy/CpxP family protein refolding chaperone